MIRPRIGLMVGRLQPLHFGHTKSINEMIQNCETAIVCLGSAQKSREAHDPWTVEERIQMLRNVYADRIKIVPLNDLHASTQKQWTDYIFDKLSKLGMKEPTDYYTGSEADAYWYKHCFWHDRLGPNLDNREAEAYYQSTEQANLRLLHIVDRGLNSIPPATDIRTLLSLRSDDWKRWVPAVNHSLVESTFPEELKVPK